MKKLLLETNLSKVYMVGVILISLILVGVYFSYAMFTVNKEKNQAISIITGNLTYDLKVDGTTSNELVVANGETKTFTVTLTNPNNRTARFNFYYVGDLADGLTAGYVVEEGVNTPPEATGVNLETSGVGSSQTYTIKVTNNSGSSKTITLGVEVGLDYNDLTLPSNGHLFEEVNNGISSILLADSANNIDTINPDQTFITGTDPNNYIWYSGKMWRAVSINPKDNTVKMVTDYSMTKIPYNSTTGSSFSGSHAEEWLNDTTEEGFLGNLRDPESFIKSDSEWNTSLVSDVNSNLPDTSSVTATVGLLNIYEYQIAKSYLSVADGFGSLNYSNSTNVWCINGTNTYSYNQSYSIFLAPAVNLIGNIEITKGNGTKENPYRLAGDSDDNLDGTLLNTRYSGEYISFGVAPNNLYRIVSKVNGLVKIVSNTVLYDLNLNRPIMLIYSDANTRFFSTSVGIGSFLNNDFVDSSNGYLTQNQISMIASGSWDSEMIIAIKEGDSYKNAISPMKVGYYKAAILRMGEQFSGLDGDSYGYWLITPYSGTPTTYIRIVARGTGPDWLTPATSQTSDGATYGTPGLRAALYLDSSIVITGGDGTEENPFTIALSS